MTAARTARAMTKACPTNSANGTNKLSTSESHHDSARSRPSCCASSATLELDVEQSAFTARLQIRVRRLRHLGQERLGDVTVHVDQTRGELAAVGPVRHSCEHEPDQPFLSAALGGCVSRGGETGQDSLGGIRIGRDQRGGLCTRTGGRRCARLESLRQASTFGSSRRSASSCTASSRAAFRSASVNAESSARSSAAPASASRRLTAVVTAWAHASSAGSPDEKPSTTAAARSSCPASTVPRAKAHASGGAVAPAVDIDHSNGQSPTTSASRQRTPLPPPCSPLPDYRSSALERAVPRCTKPSTTPGKRVVRRLGSPADAAAIDARCGCMRNDAWHVAAGLGRVCGRHARHLGDQRNDPTVNGSLQFAAFGFRGGSWSTNGGAPATPVAAFLNATTPYGAVFGSTQGSNYLSAGAASGGQPSTTTITLDSPSPPNTWGFNLGDIDADQMLIQATGPGGPLTAAQLGFQGTFNYCAPTTPRPASCGGLAHTDVPTWNPATSTLTGTGTDTQGASGWFRPTMPVTSNTLTYSVLTGIPSFQLWTSVLVWDISGAVTLDTGGPPPDGDGGAAARRQWCVRRRHRLRRR